MEFPRTTPSELRRRILAEKRGRAFLELRDGDGSQILHELSLSRGRHSIGRDPASDIPLTWDRQASRLHAELVRIGGEWVIDDQGLSRNGTFVGDERVVGRRRLREGDAIRVGTTLLLFRDPAGGGEAATASSEGDVRPPVTETQRRVLIALCRPFRDGAEFSSPATNRAIADELSLSVQAVKAHLRELFARFDVGELPQNRKRARLAELALRTGTIRPADLDAP